MLWRVAIHGGHIHPDFIRNQITDRQLHELSWYFEHHPFGHDIDHMMISRVVCSMAGGNPEDYMPVLSKPSSGSAADMLPVMPGLAGFIAKNDLEIEE